MSKINNLSILPAPPSRSHADYALEGFYSLPNVIWSNAADLAELLHDDPRLRGSALDCRDVLGGYRLGSAVVTPRNGAVIPFPDAATKPGYAYNHQNLWLQQLASNPRLSAAADLATGIALCLHMNRKTRLAWPSIDSLRRRDKRNRGTPYGAASNDWRARAISAVESMGVAATPRTATASLLKDCEGAVFSKTARPQCFAKFKDCKAAISKTATVQKEPMKNL